MEGGAATGLVFDDLLIMMIAVWGVAVLLRKVGLPTIMGELVAGVVIGPAVLGWVEPNAVIDILAQMGIFFLMLHTGVTTEPREFFSAVRSSLGIAVVGAVVPFSVAVAVGLGFGLALRSAIFVGMVMTATAVVITLRVLQDLGLQRSRAARVIIASCVIDDLLTLIMFSLALGFLKGEPFSALAVLATVIKVSAFFAAAMLTGYYLYPKFRHPFRRREGKGFTFVLILGLGFGLLAEAIGLHIILGAYLAGLFLEEKVASKELMQKVEDRLEGIAYSFLGPIFFISLGFHISFDAFTGPGLWFAAVLTVAIAIGQIVSAGGMARLARFSWLESVTVGVGMCGRAEIAFILASIGLSMGVIDAEVFSILILTTFLLNMITPTGLTICARRMRGGKGGAQ